LAIPKNVQSQVVDHPLISVLSGEETRLIMNQLDYKALRAGDTLFKEGDSGTLCYLIIYGTIVVTKRLESGHEQTLATIGSGELLGQIALIDRKPRSATCKAGTDGVGLVLLDSDIFERLYSAQNTFAFKVLDHIVSDLAKRLRSANQQLSKAKSTSSDHLRHSLSLKAAQVIAGHRYTDEELDSIEVVKTDFEESLKYSR
jgi:CRP/FNR family transcriptional regulator, cyclic AMP receptor protein